MGGAVADEVQAVLNTLPKASAKKLLSLRKLLMTVARDADVGEIVETTKWGQIAYLPKRPRTGTTVRLDATDEHLVLFVHCQTNLIAQFKAYFPEFDYDGKRAVRFPLRGRLDREALQVMLELALTYHRRKA